MISNTLKYLAYIGVIIGLLITLSLSKTIGIAIILFAITIFILSKHFENQEVANSYLENIENLLNKIYLNTLNEENFSDNESDKEENEEYKEPWLDI